MPRLVVPQRFWRGLFVLARYANVCVWCCVYMAGGCCNWWRMVFGRCWFSVYPGVRCGDPLRWFGIFGLLCSQLGIRVGGTCLPVQTSLFLHLRWLSISSCIGGTACLGCSVFFWADRKNESVGMRCSLWASCIARWIGNPLGRCGIEYPGSLFLSWSTYIRIWCLSVPDLCSWRILEVISVTNTKIPDIRIRLESLNPNIAISFQR